MASAAVLPEQAMALYTAWIGHLPAAARADAGRRAAVLLPCLMLARIDGKSPVEYLDAVEQDRIRHLVMPLIATPPGSVEEVVARVAKMPEAG
jgi:hypothetical protein